MKLINSLCLIAALFITGTVTAHATPAEDTIKARRTLRNMRIETAELVDLLKRPKVLAAVSNSRVASRLTDSDNDGSSDIIESVENTSACDNDSDDDGVSDGDEADQGTDGDDSTEGEVEVTGLISTISSQDVTVEGNTCTATDATEFRDGASLDDYQVNDNVQIKCQLQSINNSMVLVLERIQLED